MSTIKLVLRTDSIADDANAFDFLRSVKPSTAIWVLIWLYPFSTSAAAARSSLSVGVVRVSAPLA